MCVGRFLSGSREIGQRALRLHGRAEVLAESGDGTALAQRRRPPADVFAVPPQQEMRFDQGTAVGGEFLLRGALGGSVRRGIALLLLPESQPEQDAQAGARTASLPAKRRIFSAPGSPIDGNRRSAFIASFGGRRTTASRSPPNSSRAIAAISRRRSTRSSGRNARRAASRRSGAGAARILSGESAVASVRIRNASSRRASSARYATFSRRISANGSDGGSFGLPEIERSRSRTRESLVTG